MRKHISIVRMSFAWLQRCINDCGQMTAGKCCSLSHLLTSASVAFLKLSRDPGDQPSDSVALK